MTPRISVLPAAERDLEDNTGYLASEASLETALRFYDAAAATAEKIARMPGMGALWTSSRSRLADLRVCRVDGFGAYVIFYRLADDGIEIVRVLHGSRDIDNVLESESLD